MSTDPKLNDEAGRMAALRRYEVLDSQPEGAFDRITQLVATIFHAPMCTVTLVDADRQWFKSRIGLSDSEGSREASICTHTIQERVPLSIPDAMLDPRFAGKPCVIGAPLIRSYLGVPLASPDGYNVGSLCVMDVVARTHTPEQIEILKSFAALVVDELEMRRIAQTDYLTGAATRRSFSLELEKALARYQRTHTAAALVMLDVDHFKRVNDTHGHPAGDLVLKAVAGALTNALRKGDLVGRLGGEEFGVLLHLTADHPALATAERLRLHLEALAVQHDPPLRITASFGIADLDARIGSAQDWLALADEALYEAKRTGRNRCCIARAAMPLIEYRQPLQHAENCLQATT